VCSARTTSHWTLGDIDLVSLFADGLDQCLHDQSRGTQSSRGMAKQRPLNVAGKKRGVAQGGRNSAPASLVRARQQVLNLSIPPVDSLALTLQSQQSQSSSRRVSVTRLSSRNSIQDVHTGTSVCGSGVVYRANFQKELAEREHERALLASMRVELHRVAGEQNRQQAAEWRGVRNRELQISKNICARAVKIGMLKTYCSDPTKFPHLKGHRDRRVPSPEQFEEKVLREHVRQAVPSVLGQETEQDEHERASIVLAATAAARRAAARRDARREAKVWFQQRLEGKAWALHRRVSDITRRAREQQEDDHSQKDMSGGGDEKYISQQVIDQNQNARSASPTGPVEQPLEAIPVEGLPLCPQL